MRELAPQGHYDDKKMIRIITEMLDACDWTDQRTGQKFCLCKTKNCFARASIDRIDSNLAHSIANVQLLLSCLQGLKLDRNEHDFRLALEDIRMERAKSPLPLPAMDQVPVPTQKACSDPACSKGTEMQPLANFCPNGDACDEVQAYCRQCQARQARERRAAKRARH